MASADGPEGPDDDHPSDIPRAQSESVERQLFESLVHHLIEKGVLTKNDALSVVQTVAEVKRGELETTRFRDGHVRRDIAILERLYSSFDLVTERSLPSMPSDGSNVLQLRPPLHGDNPKFPKDD